MAAASVSSSVETGHAEMIHDAQLDFYSRKLATASSDCLVKVFDVDAGTGNNTWVADLKGHTGPVWEVAWAHPTFGTILASCSYDGHVYIWEERDGQWGSVHDHNAHQSSVNSIAWAPYDYGLILACASSDGSISVLARDNDGLWKATSFEAHTMGANSVSWAPSLAPGVLADTGGEGDIGRAPLRFVSGGCDNLIKVWVYDREAERPWRNEDTLARHEDWVRDVCWAANVGIPTATIASCSQDKTVVIWEKDAAGGAWEPTPLSEEPFADVVWRVSWSPTGNILAVSTGDNNVSLWKQNLNSTWACLSSMNEAGLVEAPAEGSGAAAAQ